MIRDCRREIGKCLGESLGRQVEEEGEGNEGRCLAARVERRQAGFNSGNEESVLLLPLRHVQGVCCYVYLLIRHVGCSASRSSATLFKC
jgi:hypothetical protein